MDSHLKERLIGAVVLVVLGVWLIPWVLDGPDPSASAPTEQLTLPAEQQSAPLRTQVIDLDPAGDATGPYATAREPEAEQDRASEAESAAATAAVTAVSPQRSTQTAEPQPEKPPDPVAASRKSPVENAAEAPARPNVTAEPAAAATTEFVVQLGSFGEESNARRLADRVATFGYDASVTAYRAGGRTMHRVRVGPHASRNEAEAAASSLAAHGFPAQVVTAD